MRRDTVDAPDRLRVRADGERRASTHHRQRIPIDVVDSVPRALIIAEKLLARGVGTVVLKLGGDGSMLVTAQGAEHFPAYKIDAVDPTAAGDAFTAAFTVEYAAGTRIEDAIRFANGAGALAATKLGAQSSLPTRQEVEAFVARQGRISS